MRVPRVPRVRQSASLPRRADSATPRRSRRRRCEDVESAKARTRVPASAPHKSAPHESAPPHTTSAPTHSTPEPSVAYVLDGARRLRWRRRSRSLASDGGFVDPNSSGATSRAAGRPFSKGSPASAASTRRTISDPTRAATRLAFAMRRSWRAARSPADTRRRFRLLGGLSSDARWLVQASDSRSSSFAVHSSAFAKARSRLAASASARSSASMRRRMRSRARALASRRCARRTRIGRVSAHVSARRRARLHASSRWSADEARRA